MSTSIRTAICVLGGGPAGATIARRLALLGHEVWIIERASFPRTHVGESLTPGILPLLDILGVRARVEQAEFLRPGAAIVRWGNSTDFREAPSGERGFQVDRGRFDSLLLEAAREAGTHLLQPAIAGVPEWEGPGQWRVPIRFEGQDLLLHARFIIDATGRRATLGGRKRRSGAPTLALFAYWRQTGMMGTETRVEAGPEEWFWGAPLPDGTFNATVFLDPKRCVGHTRHDLENLYRRLLERSSLLGGCLESVPTSEVLACNATTYQDTQPVREDYLKVGEASFSIDPLSSQGVQAAIRSACQGAIVVHTLLTVPQNSAAAIRFYTDQQAETVAQHSALAGRFYRAQRSFADRPFWQQRARVLEEPPKRTEALPPPLPLTLDSRVKLSEEVRWLEMPCIQDGLIQCARALQSPMLERPVAFLDGVSIAQLLDAVATPTCVGEILRQWSLHFAEHRKREWLHWMCRLRILIPWEADDVCDPARTLPQLMQ